MDEAEPEWGLARADRPDIWADRSSTGSCWAAVRRASRWFRLGSEFSDFRRELLRLVGVDLPHT